MFDLASVSRIEDVQAALETGDSAALEGQYLILEQEGKPFSLNVRLDNGRKILRLRGAAGAALNGQDSFRILWAEDVSAEDDTLAALRRGREEAEKQLAVKDGALDSLPLAVWLRDGAGDLIWANRAYAAMLGIEQKDIRANQAEIVISAKGQGRAPKDMARDALAEGKPQTSCSHIIVSGKRHWMELNEQPLPTSNMTLGFARDLTRQEDIQSELDRHRNASKTLLEQLRSAIAIFSADQGLEFYNSAFAAQWGLEDQWLNGKPKLGDILEKLREARRLPEQADFRKYKQGWLDMFTRLIDPHEDMLYLPDGSAVRMLAVPHPMGGLMMTFEDVTSRLELESSYNTLIAVQKETLDNLAEGVVVYGGDGRLKLWNPSFAKLWDLNPEELDGGPHINKIVDKKAEFFIPDDWAAVRKDLIAQGLDRSEREGQLTRTDGIHVWYATMPLPDGGVMVSYYDITDTTRVENALREKNAALEAAEQLKADFLANVSYQLRTPLNAIMGFAELLDHQYFGPLNERQKEYTGGIHESGTRLIHLIDDILDLSTIEAGYLELKKEAVDLKELLIGLNNLVTEWARKNKIEVKLSCPDNIGMIYMDERRIKQALLNLIRNAINYTPEGGTINITAEKNGDGVKIEISDTGIGIAEEDLKRIFLPFERIPSNKGTVGQAGAGLGLTLVKNIVELHGGRIDIASEEGKGTRATLTL
ncbi:MAG: histidine kinase [Micavibrio aeruginosavorus]|uniref:histidine kinase n=1 Tax=Micavibrio aeruginosavorus TaxID=349221 RepID=A0A2W5ND52_9BACT|nr:MAG: histidine kinase [Micavibrio aeruginosavorus]